MRADSTLAARAKHGGPVTRGTPHRSIEPSARRCVWPLPCNPGAMWISKGSPCVGGYQA